MASYSPPTSHSNQPQSDTENWLFLGNPGTGKSTLINCLIGEAKFEAALRAWQHRVHRYAGLADTELRETAAKSIKEALQEDGIYKIFFVVTLQQGRGKPDDIATITEVLDSVHAPNIEFSIIVNQSGKRVHELMMKMGDEYKGVVRSLYSGKYSTGSILFLPMLGTLNEVDNALINVPDELEVFLRTKGRAAEK
ncbi:uncharacterized protein PITG_12971 [Phytophthora infestans T30-4]|uniref:G domain-containing protein n=1 Tax=Phytophthora infestans (strain T30-4) TaxID=403677 RepID=D0NJZ6_PHYIT|nr:uncharacterized protein PITG_12971 [Phytophthora infestans T30-4]EEY59833.1 conserved hypothetical protein [Phytophthora infestans T30-4]|eukprot:XP_002900518.1 conserved hypothetical protein [Phytophthora infestans T30-4]